MIDLTEDLRIKNRWHKDRDGTWNLYVDPEASISNTFNFTLGEDASCVPITISSFTTSTNDPVSVVSSSNTDTTVTLKTKGVGEVLIILTLSDGDIRRPIRRYTESNKSRTF